MSDQSKDFVRHGLILVGHSTVILVGHRTVICSSYIYQ